MIMKSIVFVLLLCCSSICMSQVKIGIAAGGNLGNFPGDDDIIISRGNSLNLTELIGGGNATINTVENKSRLGLNLGLTLEHSITEDWNIESGVFYSAQGDKIQGDAILTINVLGETEERDVEYIATTITDYIVIPIKARRMFSNHFSAVIGPQLGLRLNGSKGVTEGFFPFTNDTLEFEEEVDDRLQSFDFGGIGGIQYIISDSFRLSAEQYLAATRLIEERNVYHSVTSLKVFYTFN